MTPTDQACITNWLSCHKTPTHHFVQPSHWYHFVQPTYWWWAKDALVASILTSPSHLGKRKQKLARWTEIPKRNSHLFSSGLLTCVQLAHTTNLEKTFTGSVRQFSKCNCVPACWYIVGHVLKPCTFWNVSRNTQIPHWLTETSIFAFNVLNLPDEQ